MGLLLSGWTPPSTNLLVDVLSLMSDFSKVVNNRLVAVLHLRAVNLQVFANILWTKNKNGQRHINLMLDKSTNKPKHLEQMFHFRFRWDILSQ